LNTSNPLLGVLFHWLGGLASASFYVPYKRVRRWSWEIFWLVGGVFSWIFALLRTKHLFVGAEQDTRFDTPLLLVLESSLGLRGPYVRLTMRYLGISP
jgi:L-rhamnose-H+ transport protein